MKEMNQPLILQCKKNQLFDTVLIVIALLIIFFLSGIYDFLEKIVSLSKQYEHLEIDEILITSAFLVCFLSWFSWRRWKEIGIMYQKLIHQYTELEKAHDEIETLKGILPICSHCKKIRNEKGEWNQFEFYIEGKSSAEFSHSICPDCAKEHYSHWLGNKG